MKQFFSFNDKISDLLSGYSVISFYATFILVAGTYVANFLSNEPEKIIYTDLPHPEIIINLCEGIEIARYNQDFKEEESLYTILIELMRSPDLLKKITQSSLQNLEIRKINNVEKEEEEEEEENDLENENKKDDDDENDDYYEDKKESEDKKQEPDKKPENGEEKKEGDKNAEKKEEGDKSIEEKKEGDKNEEDKNIEDKNIEEKKEGENNDIQNEK